MSQSIGYNFFNLTTNFSYSNNIHKQIHISNIILRIGPFFCRTNTQAISWNRLLTFLVVIQIISTFSGFKKYGIEEYLARHLLLIFLNYSYLSLTNM